MDQNPTRRLEHNLGQQLALALAAAVRIAAYYEESNVVMQQAVTRLMEVLDEYWREDSTVSIAVHSHSVFVDRVRIPTTAATYERFSLLADLFERWGISQITFSHGISAAELVLALKRLSRPRGPAGQSLEDLLTLAGVKHVVVEEAVTEEEAFPCRRVFQKGGAEIISLASVLAYSGAIKLSVELRRMESQLEPGCLRRARHVAQSLVDEIRRDPGSVLALTTIKDFDRYLMTHSVNVAVLSTLLGQYLGLDRVRLGELCLAGFLHDAGKLGVEQDILQKPAVLTEEERGEVRRHPLMAVRSLLTGKRLTLSGMRAAVVAFEHHLNYDLSGYPPVRFRDHQSLFGRIVAVADQFDALTTARVYRPVNLTPPEAIKYLLQRAGTTLDPVLVGLFVRVVGVYPPGTAVVLTNGEKGVVCKPPTPGAPLDRPFVRVLVGSEPGSIRDLSERNENAFALSVAGIINPQNQGQIPAVDPALFAEFAASTN